MVSFHLTLSAIEALFVAPWCLVWSAGTAKRRTVPESPLRFTKPLAGRYDGVPDGSDEPALVPQPFGKGEGVYFSGEFGGMVSAFHTPEYLRLAANAVATLAPPPVKSENLPSSVKVVLRSQDRGRRLLLHLVNFTGDMMRPIRSVVTLSGVHVMLDGSVRKASTLMRPQSLALDKQMPDRTRFVLPRLEEYQVVVIEK